MCPVGQYDAADRLPVDERTVGGAAVHEHHLIVLDAKLRVMPRHAGVDQAQIAVGAAAEQGDRRLQLISALLTALIGAADEEPGLAGEAAGLHPRQVAGRLPDLAALDRGAADHAGPDPEGAGGQVADALEPHAHGPDERVALLFGIVPGEVRQLDAQALRVHLEPLVIGVRDLDHAVVRYQSPPLGDDGCPVVHLTLNRARHLDRLQFGLEGAREGALDHALEPSLESLQDSHRATSLRIPRIRWYPGRKSARGRANLTRRPGRVAERQTRTVQVRVSERM